MKSLLLNVLLPISLMLLALPLLLAAGEAKEYVCPPCDMPCDARVFDKPGTCPACGVRLVEKRPGAAASAGAAARPKAAILIFDGVQIIDYTGPYEVFGQGGFEVYTVAEAKDALTTSMGMTVVPKFTFADAPKPDVVIVPGGNVTGPTGSAATLAWVKEQSKGAKHVLSVCNGAFILAKAGLLDNLSATTFYGLIDELRTAAPKTRVVSDRRFVDNGAIITSAGLSSGIDGALHVLSRMLGQGRAQAAALHMEYDWRPDSGYARAALADRLLRDIDLRDLGETTILRTEGTRDRWEVAVGLRTDLKAADLRQKVEGALGQGHWIKAGSDQTASATTSAWRRTEADGAAWKGRLTIQPDPAQDGQFTLTMNITR
jgi:putative intracellular protease/amidase